MTAHATGLPGRLLLLSGSFLFCAAFALGAELALRLVRPSLLEAAPALQPHVYSPVYGWRLRPSWQGRTRDGRTVRTNRAGFRGPAAGAGAPGRRRVLLLGDSLTFGTGVDDGVTPKPYFTAEGQALRLHDEHLRLGWMPRLAQELRERSVAFDALLALAGERLRAPLDHDDGEHWGPRARVVLEHW